MKGGIDEMLGRKKKGKGKASEEEAIEVSPEEMDTSVVVNQQQPPIQQQNPNQPMQDQSYFNPFNPNQQPPQPLVPQYQQPVEQQVQQPPQPPVPQQIQQPPQVSQQPVQQVSQQPVQQVEQVPQPMNQQVEQVEQTKTSEKEVKGTVRILSGELVEIGDAVYYKYTILTNKSIGLIGEDFPLN